MRGPDDCEDDNQIYGTYCANIAMRARNRPRARSVATCWVCSEERWGRKPVTTCCCCIAPLKKGAIMAMLFSLVMCIYLAAYFRTVSYVEVSHSIVLQVELWIHVLVPTVMD